MRGRTAIAVALGLAVVLARPAAGQQEALLHGFVADEATGEPIESAEVILVEAGASTRTDRDGAFAFADAPLGRFFVAPRVWRSPPCGSA